MVKNDSLSQSPQIHHAQPVEKPSEEKKQVSFDREIYAQRLWTGILIISVSIIALLVVFAFLATSGRLSPAFEKAIPGYITGLIFITAGLMGIIFRTTGIAYPEKGLLRLVSLFINWQYRIFYEIMSQIFADYPPLWHGKGAVIPGVIVSSIGVIIILVTYNITRELPSSVTGANTIANNGWQFRLSIMEPFAWLLFLVPIVSLYVTWFRLKVKTAKRKISAFFIKSIFLAFEAVWILASFNVAIAYSLDRRGEPVIHQAQVIEKLSYKRKGKPEVPYSCAFCSYANIFSTTFVAVEFAEGEKMTFAADRELLDRLSERQYIQVAYYPRIETLVWVRTSIF